MAAKKKAATAGGKDGDVQYVDTDADGQGRIPGTEVATIPEIQQFVRRHEASKEAHAKLTNKLEEENDQAISLFTKYKDHFSTDRKGNFIYSDETGVYLEIPKPGKVKPKTKIIPPANSEAAAVASAEKKPGGKKK